MILSLYAEEMSERGRQGRKRYFPPGLRELWRGLACPSRISFSASCALRKHVSSPLPVKQPFSRPCTSRSTARPGNQPFFRPYTSHSTARPGKQPFFRPYPSQISVSAGQTLLLSPSVHSEPASGGRAVEYLILWLYLRNECRWSIFWPTNIRCQCK